MTLLASESFGISNTWADFAALGYVTSSYWPTSIGSPGPLGGNYVQIGFCLSTYGESYVQHMFPAALQTFYTGRRFSFLGGTAPGGVVFLDAAATPQVSVVLDPVAGSVSVRAKDSGTVLGVTSGSVIPGGWFYLEVGGTISSTTGSVTVRINGATVLAVAGVDTQNGAAGSAAMTRETGYNYGSRHAYTDWYLCDATGAGPDNTFLGDVQVQCLNVVSNDVVQFTPPANQTAATGTLAASANNSVVANTLYFEKVSVAVGGVLQSTTMTLATAVSGNVAMAIYPDDGAGDTMPSGPPIATSNTLANPGAGAAAFTYGTAPRLLSGGTYWLAVLSDTTVGCRQNATNPANTLRSLTTAFSGGFPASFTTGGLSTALFYMGVVLAPTNADAAAAAISAGVSNRDATVGDQDTFNLGTINSQAVRVVGVCGKAILSKSDSGLRSAAVVVKSGSTAAVGTTVALGTSAGYVANMQTTDPNTSAAWTVAGAQAAKVGYRVVA